jgi:phosphoglycerate kinase
MKLLKDLEIKNRRLLLRTDYDIPLKEGKVADETRIQASLPTIKNLLKRKAKTITILCHLDRPGGKLIRDLKVKPVAELLKTLLPQDAPVEIEENLRFNPGEEENNLEFAKKLAQKAEAFVNDAFAVSHRPHASIVSLPKLLPSAIGLHFQKEVKALNKVRANPKRPVLFILGGAKLETKLPLIEKLAKIADEILVGGKLAQEIGSASSPEAMASISVARLTQNGKDILEQSAEEFAKKISKAGTIVWNGPMGVYEQDETSLGTMIVAQAINNAPGYTVIGGGDTEAAATKFDAEEKINHISMGGGAMLQYLADGTLVGLKAIEGGLQ